MEPPDGEALDQMNPLGRFSDRAGDYARYRPTYPAAAIDAILHGLAEPASLAAADVGAGTGISARQLAARGMRVFAVEPNAAMRAAAALDARVAWRDGTAEATGLDSASVNLVLCAQAFHWFRQRESVAEFHRILVSGGRLALMWNSRDNRDPLTLGFIQAIHAVHGEDPVELRGIDPGAIEGDGLFTVPALETFAHEQVLDHDGLIGRAASASYVPKDGPGFAKLCTILSALFERHRDAAGQVRMKYVTKVHLAERRERLSA